jgi:hypothetical protein
MNAPAPLAAQPKSAQGAVKDGRTGARTGNAHKGQPGSAISIAEIHSLVAELMRVAHSGRMSYGHRTVREGGRVAWHFVSEPAVTLQKSRLELLIEWMRETRKLGRFEAMEGCPAAGNSSSLHDQARRVLAKRGEIVKEGRYLVWVDEEMTGGK